MSLSVVLKPSGIQAVGTGSLNYTFSEGAISGKPNYRVEIELNGLSSVPKFQFRADSTGAVTADIAGMLRLALAMSFTTTSRFISTYVKYQGIWDGGSYSQVALSSDVIYAYIGSINQLNPRTKNYIDGADVQGAVLVPNVNNTVNPSPGYHSGELLAWNGYYAFMDFIHTNNVQSASPKYIAGVVFPDTTLHPHTVPKISTYDGTVYGLRSFSWYHQDNLNASVIISPSSTVDFNLSALSNNVDCYYGAPGFDYISGDGFAQTFLTNAIGMVLSVKVKKLGSPTNTIDFRIYGTSAGLPNLSDLKATMTVDLSDLIAGVNTDILLNDFNFSFSSATTYALVIIPNNDGTTDLNNYYRFYTSSTSQMANGSVCNRSGFAWSADTNKDLAGWYWSSISYVASYNIETMSACINPIQLKWLNDYGGTSTWVFDYNQVLENAPQDAFRLRNVLISAEGVTKIQWEMLQQLNRNGIDYGDNLKSGTLVQDITDSSNPINVFVLPEPRQTQSRLLGHRFECTIRYPRIDNIGI